MPGWRGQASGPLFRPVDVRLAAGRALAVVAKRTVAEGYGGADPLLFRRPDKFLGFKRVAHDAVDDRAKQRGMLDALAIEDLVGDEFHRGKLGYRNLRQLVDIFPDLVLELVLRIGEVDQANIDRFLARERRPVSA